MRSDMSAAASSCATSTGWATNPDTLRESVVSGLVSTDDLTEELVVHCHILRVEVSKLRRVPDSNVRHV